jgi:formate dehydrogenase maturation protein FdhE
MIEIQKTIIHFGNKILQELKELKTIKEEQLHQNKSNKEPISSTIYDMDAPIRKYLQTIKIAKGYGGRS